MNILIYEIRDVLGPEVVSSRSGKFDKGQMALTEMHTNSADWNPRESGRLFQVEERAGICLRCRLHFNLFLFLKRMIFHVLVGGGVPLLPRNLKNLPHVFDPRLCQRVLRVIEGG